MLHAADLQWGERDEEEHGDMTMDCELGGSKDEKHAISFQFLQNDRKVQDTTRHDDVEVALIAVCHTPHESTRRAIPKLLHSP